MKHSINVALVLLASFALSSCTVGSVLSDTSSEALLVEYSIAALRETDYSSSELSDQKTPITKTQIMSDGQVFWSNEEAISLFVGANDNGGYKMTASNDSPQPIAVFNGVAPANDGHETLWAVYPYKETTTFDGKEIVIDLPCEQIAKKGSFEDDIFISIARSDTQDFVFYNVCGGIVFTVSEPGIRQVSVRNLSGTEIAGRLHVRFDNNGIPYVKSVVGSIAVTVTAPDNGCFEVGEKYYVVCAPKTFYDGLIFTYRTEEKYAVYKRSKETVINRSNFGRLLEKDHNLEFKKSSVKFNMDVWGWCEGIHPRDIEEINFHVRSGHSGVTYRGKEDGEVFYIETKGKVLDIFTAANCFEPENCYELFQGCRSLESIDLSSFDTGNVTDMTRMFDQCSRLKTLDLSNFRTPNVSAMNGMFNYCFALESLNLHGFDTSNVEEMTEMFRRCTNLKELDAVFDLQNCRTLHHMFEDCWNLKRVKFSDSPSFKLQNARSVFQNCYGLNVLDLGGLDLSSAISDFFIANVAASSRNCVISCTGATKVVFIEDNTTNFDWITWVLPGEQIPEVSDLVYPGVYRSSDYTMDGKIEQIQHASVNNGIDLYFMGDAYSDRLIASGKYLSDVHLAVDAIFSEEPFRSFKDFFNIFVVYSVSPNEDIDYVTTFGSSVDPMSAEIGFMKASFVYLESLLYNYDSRYNVLYNLGGITTMTLINHDSGHGEARWSMSLDNQDSELDYGHEYGAAYVTRCSNNDQFQATVLHEFGHAFAKLGDEYWYDDGLLPDEFTIDFLNNVRQSGHFGNISTTSDPALVPWSQFLTDDRYANSGTGIYEGGYLYANNIWRCSEESIMRYNTGGYNAISRKLIYNKIHKEVYGKSWKFDYDGFVQQDLKNLHPITMSSVRQTTCWARSTKKPIFKIEESTTSDGRKMATIVID